ncbi:MAG TPA: hypothetical protein VKF35_04940 [Hyphomicrobiaceae bacterium]|nr:hypothetical protein [Hyphomicrobiaceae bacterium]
MKLPTLALLLALASLSHALATGPAAAGSCSHCVFDDDATAAPKPKLANVAVD